MLPAFVYRLFRLMGKITHSTDILLPIIIRYYKSIKEEEGIFTMVKGKVDKQ